MATLTNDQWIVIAFIFLAGTLLGLWLRSGGAKWRVKYQAEHDAHTALRRDYDALLKRHETVRPADRDTLRTGSF